MKRTPRLSTDVQKYTFCQAHKCRRTPIAKLTSAEVHLSVSTPKKKYTWSRVHQEKDHMRRSTHVAKHTSSEVQKAMSTPEKKYTWGKVHPNGSPHVKSTQESLSLKYPSLLQVLPFTIEESFTHQIELSDIKNEVDYLGFHHHRTTRTMSCPTKLKAEEESNLFKRAASNFAVTGLKLTELRRDFLPTIKTLAMLFLYLLMSSPFYISATVHRHCSPVQVSNHKLTLSLIGLFS